jgi:hypothetical protein
VKNSGNHPVLAEGLPQNMGEPPKIGKVMSIYQTFHLRNIGDGSVVIVSIDGSRMT